MHGTNLKTILQVQSIRSDNYMSQNLKYYIKYFSAPSLTGDYETEKWKTTRTTMQYLMERVSLLSVAISE
jgi:hypothetical protein